MLTGGVGMRFAGRGVLLSRARRSSQQGAAFFTHVQGLSELVMVQ